MTLRFGDEKSLMNTSTAADLAGDMLMRGTAKHTRQQIKDEFDRLKARVRISGGPTQAAVSIETTRENLPAVLTLAAECLRESAFPATEFEQLKQETLADIEQGRSEPQQIASTAYRRHLSPYPKGDVRYISTPDEDLAEVKAATLEDAKKFYADFYGASVGELALVGDFDAEGGHGSGGAVSSAAGRAPRSFTRVPNVFQDVPAVNKSFEAPDKANAFFIAGQNLALRDDDPDYPALVLGNYMLGGGFLNSRLATRIRQKEGLSYGVGSQFQASPLDKPAPSRPSRSTPRRTPRSSRRPSRRRSRGSLKDGFEARRRSPRPSPAGSSRGRSRARRTPPLARTLAADLYLKRTLAWDADLEKKVAGPDGGRPRRGAAQAHRPGEDLDRQGR